MRLLANTILVVPLADADEQVSAGGIVCVNHHKKTNLKFRVLAVGPGAYRKRTSARTGRTRVTQQFDKPECEVGDCILTRADLDDGIVKEAFDDGTGRLIINGHDARGNSNVLMVWKQ